MNVRRVWLAPLGSALALSPGLATAQTAAGVETRPPATWNFSVFTDATWSENPYFLGVTESTSTWSGHARASLGRSTRFKNGSFSISGFGGAVYYPDIESFSQPTYGGSLHLATALSRRWNLTLGQTYSRSNTRYLTETDPEGLPLPTSSVSYAVSSVGLSRELGKRWHFSMNGSYSLRGYNNELLTGGQQLGAGAQISHSIGRQTNVFLAYGYGASWFDDGLGQGPQRTHQGLLGFRKGKDRVSFELAGGAAYLENTESVYPAGRAGLTVTGRKASLSAYYSRDFGQAFGYGTQMIGDLAGAAVSWAPVRRVTFNARYNFGYRREPGNETYYVRSHIATVSLGWQVGGGVSCGASYSRDRNETYGRRVVEGSRASVSLSYGVNWH